MTHQLVIKLENLAASAEGSLSAAANTYGPKLREAADSVGHKLEVWAGAVDAWTESHFATDSELLREQAGLAYRNAVVEAHKLMDEAKGHL